MKFSTNAKNINLGLNIIVLADIVPAELEETKVFENGKQTDENKLVDGKPTFTLRGIAVMEGSRQQRNVSIKVFSKPKDIIPVGSRVALVGEVSLTPYVGSNGRVGLSILAESVEVQA